MGPSPSQRARKPSALEVRSLSSAWPRMHRQARSSGGAPAAAAAMPYLALPAAALLRPGACKAVNKHPGLCPLSPCRVAMASLRGTPFSRVRIGMSHLQEAIPSLRDSPEHRASLLPLQRSLVAGSRGTEAAEMGSTRDKPHRFKHAGWVFIPAFSSVSGPFLLSPCQGLLRSWWKSRASR